MISKETHTYQSMDKLQDTLIDAVVRMRDRVAELEDPPSYFELTINVSGRVLDGELEVTFAFDPGSYHKATKGGTLSATFDEFMRRYGWQKRNAPLCLPKVVEKTDEDEEVL
jgi:hypothetical protein